MTELVSRFWDKVLIGDGCWEWQASKLKQGYGMMRWRGRNRLAHRIALELWTGDIPPDDLDVLHACDNPSCVRPAHLFLGTHSDNMQDMFAKGRGVSAEAKRTHCPQGHPYDEVNTYRKPGTNKRSCRACHREQMRARRACA